jgi:hypothetical protein
MGIEEILAEREKTHGQYEVTAEIIQDLKKTMTESPNWDNLPSTMREALEMNQHKIGRILSGDFNHIDSWRDIVGYNQLVVNILERDQVENVIAT